MTAMDYGAASAHPEARAERRVLHTIAAGAVVFALQFIHGPAQAFIYDAVQYWGAPIALLTGGNVSEVGVLQIRGVLSTLVYLPPAAFSVIFGSATASWAVLAWNALLAAFLCVWLFPRMAALMWPGPFAIRIWVSAIVGGVILSGYARYPHLDIWAAAFAFTGIFALAASSRGWILALGGLSVAVAVNLRPAYLAALAIAVLILLVTRPRRIVWSVPAVLIGMIPQVAFNIVWFGQFDLSPVATPFLLRVQAAQATFAVRYDTIAFVDRHPQQWYCDPDYAQLLLGDDVPTGPLGVLASAATHFPQSLWLFAQKAAASLHWSFATPTENPPGGTSLMAFLIVAVAAFGIVALVWRSTRVWRDRDRRGVALALLGFWVGSVATLVLSIPETRFALPLVLVGLIGGLTAIPPGATTRAARRALLGTAIVAVLVTCAVFAIGKAGLSHPMPPGPLLDATACVEQAENQAR